MKTGLPVLTGPFSSAPPRARISAAGSREISVLTGRAICRVLRLAIICAVLLLCGSRFAWGNLPGGYVSTITTPVTTGTTSYNGSECVWMDNGIVHAIINVSGGTIVSLRFLKPGLAGTPLQNGIEMVAQSGGSTTAFGGHTSIYYSAPGNMTFGPCTFSFATPPTSTMADIAFAYTFNPQTSNNPWDTIQHWVLRQGDTGIYGYFVENHQASYPTATNAGITLLWPFSHDATNFLLEDVFVDNLGTGLLDNRGFPESRRHGLNVSFEDTEYLVPTVQDNDQVINTDPNSKFYGYLETKYSYIDDLFLLNCWGRASDINHLGAWFVQGSHEFSPSGPAYTDFTQGWGLVYDCLTTLHGVQANYTIPQGTAFRKVYGPTFLYMNTLATGTANWADAQQQSLAEQAAWPYSWLTSEPGYQTVSQRATVTGNITITDQLNSQVSGSGAWVGLAAPDTGVNTGGVAPFQASNWMTQARWNQYWVQAGANGSFTFPNIVTTDGYGNPEQYSLYVYNNGVSGSNGSVGEYMGPSFTATAGETLNLGTVTWNVPHKGASIVWQIGNPDRLSDEFNNWQTSFQPQNWEYMDSGYNDMNSPPGGANGLYYQYPNPLEYDTATGSAAQLSWIQTDDNGLWPWNLNFNLSGAPASGNYWLTIAYAGDGWPGSGVVGDQEISVNGVALFFDLAGFQQIGLCPGNHGEQNQAHLGSHGTYSVVHVPIPSSMLQSGSNTITLTADGIIEYDYIDLEAPALVDDGIYTLSIENSGTNLYTLGISSTTSTNTAVYTYPGAGGTLNQWRVTNLGSAMNYCEFINAASGLALTGSGGQVIQAPLVGSSNQIWEMEAGQKGGYLLLCSGQGNEAANGQTITQPYTSGSNAILLSGSSGSAPGQNWVFTAAAPVVTCTNAVATNIGSTLSIWVTTGTNGSNFAPAADFTASGFTWTPTNNPGGTAFSATGLPPGVTIDPVTGLISGGATAIGTFNVTIMATNSGGTGSQEVAFTVASALSGLTGPGTQKLTTGVPYSYKISGTSNSPTGFGATGLPPGITINTSTGVISGTATVAGSYPGTVSVSNAGGTNTASVTFDVVSPLPVITSSLTASGEVGSGFSYTLTASNLPTSFAAAGYPAGLSFNTGSGVLSGTPVTAGTSSVIVNASNDGGTSTSGTLTLTVYAQPTVAPAITSAASASGTAGVAFDYLITATNLPASYTASGLPGGLTVNTATGLISGTAALSGVSTVTLTGSNKIGTGTGTLTLTIVNPAAPVISSSGTVAGEALAPFTYSIIASNNPTGYNAGGLPGGLNLNPTTGVISGEPAAAGSSVVMLSATNQGGTGTGSITIEVSGSSAPVISSSSSDTETAGVPVNFQITAANGPASFTAGNLPLGLSVNSSTGLISGTPGITGSFSISLAASNVAGTGTAPLSMIVNAPSWAASDVGTVGGWFGDSTTYTSGTYTVIGAGAGYTGTADAFQFAYQPLAGNGAIVARVDSLANLVYSLNGGARAGVMIRASTLDPSAPYFAVSIQNGSTAYAQWRTTEGSSAGSSSAGTPSVPYWVKVVRVGNVFTGYCSSDGVNWAQVGSPETITMPVTVYAGLAATDEGNNETVAATFDNVDFAPGGLLWYSNDIGAVTAAGDSSYSGGVATLVSTGTDIGNTSDQFHYVYLPADGNCSMTVQVTGVSNTNPNAKAGIMIRDTLGSGSDFADLVATAGNGISFQERSASGAAVSTVSSNGALQCPYWLMLTRSGNNFTAYTAPDGATWTQLGSTSITMGTNAFIGVAATSDNTITAGAATVDNISVTTNNNPAAPVINSALTITGTAGVQFNYAMSATNNPTGFAAAALPGGLIINNSTGVISGAPTGTGNNSVPVYAQNAGGLGTATVSMDFVSAAPVIMPSAAPVPGTVNQSFSYSISTQNSPTSYSQTGLPPGLAFSSSSGVYSGTPTTTGTFTVSETASNASGSDSATQMFVFTAAAPDITSSLNVTGTGYDSFDYTIMAGSGPTSFGAINLPPGLSINSSTGLISGTPLETGSFTIYITASNPDGTAGEPVTLTLDAPPPAAPALETESWDKQVDLLWNVPTGATGYNVLRATVAAGPYAVIAASLAAPYYSDKAVADGSNYYYEVNAYDTTGTGSASTPVEAAPVPLGANAWEHGDIGAVGLTGTTTYLSGTYTVAGSGNDIQGTADAFQFNSQQMTGDGAIVARVVSVQNTSPSAKAGIMIRDSLAANAANATILLTPSNGIISQWRVTDGGSTAAVAQTGLAASYWVELERAGNVFTTYYSPDGLNWTQQSSQTIAMPVTIYAGLAVTAQNNSALCTAKIDNVNILPNGAWAAMDIGSPSIRGFTAWSNGTLTVNASGSDIYNTSDQFRYVYQPVSGNCSVTAEVTGVENANNYSKGGVMIRDTLAANSDNVAVIATPEGGIYLQERSVTGGSSAQTEGPDVNTPYWLRLTRSGNFFEAYTSQDGNVWTLFATTTASMGTNSYIGIALSNKNTSVLSAATFADIAIYPSPAPVISSTLSATVPYNQGFAYQIASTNSPTSFNASGLPAGLSVNTSTGLISGTTAATGSSNVTISAANFTGSTSATLILTVNPPPPVISSTLAAAVPYNQLFTYQIAATNTPASFNASGLPAGLNVDTSMGLISGSTTASGTTYVTISAANVTGSASAILMLTVAPAPSPAIANLGAGSITSTGAVLTATVNPNATNASAYFQVGTTTAYGNESSSVQLGSGTNPVPINTPLSGLSAGITYHYQLVVTTGNGTYYSSDETFTTTPSQVPAMPPWGGPVLLLSLAALARWALACRSRALFRE